jgi:hypothetical protein
VIADISTKAAGTPPVYVFILSWERPIYLWVALDSLYRRTKSPARFVLIDNGSQNPLVHSVIEAFERRSMFHAVHRMAENQPENLHRILDQYLPECGPTFCYVESDISIEEPRTVCWLATMRALFDKRPKLAMLGSYIDVRDFADIESTRRLVPSLNDEEYSALVKANSPERTLSETPPSESVVSPFNPPGRLLMLRTEAIRTVGMRSDAALHHALQAQGWDTGISTTVLHRHLSLLHVFDEPSYDSVSRAQFFERITASADDHRPSEISNDKRRGFKAPC